MLQAHVCDYNIHIIWELVHMYLNLCLLVLLPWQSKFGFSTLIMPKLNEYNLERVIHSWNRTFQGLPTCNCTCKCY